MYGRSVIGLVRDEEGRVRGAKLSGSDREVTEVSADLVIGADGMRSRVARVLEAKAEYVVPDAACSIYGYWPDVPLEGYHWFYEVGISIGTIPTNDGDTCVFALLPQAQFNDRRHEGLEALFLEALGEVSPELADAVSRGVRDTGCDVLVNAAYRDVSRRHLIIEVDGGSRVRLTDISSHGTSLSPRLLENTSI